MAGQSRALKALARTAWREGASLGSVKLNNLFLVVILLAYGSLAARQRPYAAGQFLLVIGLLLLAPLAADPLSYIPRSRLALWPLSPADRIRLRVVSFGLSPAVWLAILLPTLIGFWEALPIGALLLAVLVLRVAIGGANPVASPPHALAYLHLLPGKLGLLSLNLRQQCSVLDFYAALLFSLSGMAYRLFASQPEREAFPILSVLVALSLSTYAQALFALDGASGVTRYRLLPLPGRDLLLAKDLIYLALLAVFTAPLDLGAGLTFGFVSLAIGNFASVLHRTHQPRWRFTAGRLNYGVAQLILGAMLAIAEARQGWGYLAASSAAWAASLLIAGRLWEKQR